LTRKSTIEVTLPRFNFQTQTVTKALASVRPEDSNGRILLYDASGSTTTSVRNKYSSSLTMTLAAAIARSGAASQDLRIHSDAGNTWSYQLLYVKRSMKREDFEALSRPFVERYLANHFAGGTSLSTWYNMLESTSEELLRNGPETYGDTCASFEVSVPGEVLGSWLTPVGNVEAAAQRMSIAIQKSLKGLLPTFYFAEAKKLTNLASAAPLLAWASIPPAVAFDGDSFKDSGGKNVYWDWPDVNLRRRAALNAQTVSNLRVQLPGIRLRLQEAGLNSFVQFYEAGKILTGANSTFGDNLFRNLFFFEALIVEKAKDALKEIQKFLDVADSSPTEAVKRLAAFAADITEAFGKLTGESVFADLKTFRAVAEVVFLHATRALTGVSAKPDAMMTLYILKNPTAFVPASFLTGSVPKAADVAVPQRIVSI
jgi:hypothetical protein